MKRKFFNDEFYHIFNQGTDKRRIYSDKSDYLRFIHDLYEFNNSNSAIEFSRSYNIEKLKVSGKFVPNLNSHEENLGKGWSREKKKDDKKSNKNSRDKLVNIYAFVMMPNHHHILAEQIQANGISLFMSKLHGGYSRAFNLKYKRSGHLFQGPFKSIHIKDDIHSGFLICYLHSKPLDFWKKNWRDKRLNDQEIKQALKFLEKYKYSSHLDYAGKKNFAPVISREFLLDFFDGTKGYNEFFVDWLKQYQKNIKYIKENIFY